MWWYEVNTPSTLYDLVGEILILTFPTPSTTMTVSSIEDVPRSEEDLAETTADFRGKGDGRHHDQDEFAEYTDSQNNHVHYRKPPPTPHVDFVGANGRSYADYADRKLIGIDGKWYDITAFIPYHPGGDIIDKFVGKDATAVFRAMHHKDVLGKRQPVGYFTRDLSDPASVRFAQLRAFFEREGYFETDYLWYARKVLVTLALLAVVVYLLVTGQSLTVRLVGAVMLAAFWQQCGFHLHDFMHNQVLHDRKWDQRLGVFFGTACLGLSASWWRDEHFIHHALTNTVHIPSEFADPQMREPIWAQNSTLFPFFKTRLEAFFIRIQHYTFVPVCLFLGRAGIIIDSMKDERRWYEIVAFALHCLATVVLFSYIPTWEHRFYVYFTASSFQGILHVQLLTNHYAKAFFHLDSVLSKDWHRMQIECNLNVENPWWLDWFHGGLNLHIEHHLFPTMPRHNFRKASVHIRKLCEELGIHYHAMPLSHAVVYVLKHLKASGKLFSLDPR